RPIKTNHGLIIKVNVVIKSESSAKTHTDLATGHDKHILGRSICPVCSIELLLVIFTQRKSVISHH
ncbi:MAG: hypothetical protein VYD75_09250, partial [Pseudomonadota bacterium]|nr:hypothetical protein [Pseudomonadota bacterium]